jgi:hypothetical protein
MTGGICESRSFVWLQETVGRKLANQLYFFVVRQNETETEWKKNSKESAQTGTYSMI